MLNGQTVLIVEREFLIALDIQSMLESISVREMLLARSFAEANELAHRWGEIDLAIVEMGEDCVQTVNLLTALRAAGVSLVLSTTDNSMTQGHRDFPDTPVVTKPMAEDHFRRAVSAALANSPRTNGYVS